MKRTFEIKLIVTVNSDFAINEIMRLKEEILSGKMKRAMTQPETGFVKATATFTELNNS